jgi:hypothetical protein
MKKLTKIAIAATCISALALYVTSDVASAVVSDGKSCFDAVYWRVPFYGLVRMPDRTWWIFIRVWLLCFVSPVILWIVVGVKKLIARPSLSQDHGERS